jgi:predicted nucleic acid-binding Zn finger protein
MNTKRLTGIIEGAEEKRIKRALTGLLKGTYKVYDLRQKNGEIEACVSKGDGTDYGVAINGSQVFCHCPDFFFTNEGICKHVIMLSLALLSESHQESRPHIPPEPDESLVNVSDSFAQGSFKMAEEPETGLEEPIRMEQCPNCNSNRLVTFQGGCAICLSEEFADNY